MNRVVKTAVAVVTIAVSGLLATPAQAATHNCDDIDTALSASGAVLADIQMSEMLGGASAVMANHVNGAAATTGTLSAALSLTGTASTNVSNELAGRLAADVTTALSNQVNLSSAVASQLTADLTARFAADLSAGASAGTSATTSVVTGVSRVKTVIRGLKVEKRASAAVSLDAAGKLAALIDHQVTTNVNTASKAGFATAVGLILAGDASVAVVGDARAAATAAVTGRAGGAARTK